MPDWPAPFFSLMTQLGSPLILITLSAAAFVLGRSNIRALAAVLLIGLLLGNVIMNDIKYVVERPRPDGARIYDFIVSVSYSFPSGHTLLSFLAASIIGGFLGWKFRLAAYFAAFLIAISRLYLVVHYATDVLAGALIGIMIGELAVYFAYRLGLCENRGIAGLIPSHLLKQSPGATIVYSVSSANVPLSGYNILISVPLIFSIYAINNGLNRESLALTLAVSLLVILITCIRAWKTYPGLSLFFFIIASGYNLMFLAFTCHSYRLSLLIFPLMVIALIWLTWPKKRPSRFGKLF